MTIDVLALFLTSLAFEAPVDRPLAEQFAELKKECEAGEKRFLEALAAAGRDPKKNEDVNEAHFRDLHRLSDSVGDLMKAHPHDPSALDGAMIIVGTLRYGLSKDIVPIARKHALVDPRAGEFCFLLRFRGAEGYVEEILRVVSEQHPRREVRGQAVFALGDFYRYTANTRARKVTEPEKAGWLAKARHRYEEALRDYADLPTPDGKGRLAVRARAELTRLDNLPDLKIGRPAPEIVGDDLDGKPLKLSDYRGKVVVVCFWATSCRPCLEMVPHEQSLAKRLDGKPFALLGVNCDEPGDRDKARKTAAERGMTWPSWWDGDRCGPISAYDIAGLPRVFVLDSEGVIRAIDVRGKDLDGAVDRLLAE